ncbi:zinc transporter 5-like [Corylus avellana]|uniref:zinc transporter 5-like n=1 Tax=Corylus avellana TaxID=13451 RepID=UPI00286B85C6|nr:zinc transporter 5-like [Corylus avellana]
MSTLQQIFCLFFLILLPPLVSGDCTCDADDGKRDKHQALEYKLAAITSILIAGAIGVYIPLLGKTIPTLRPEKGVFFMIKVFAAGVILSTGFIHMLLDAFKSLTSSCLDKKPWQTFAFTGFVAMTSAILTLMVDAFAKSYYRSSSFNSDAQGGVEDAEKAGDMHIHAHAHAMHAYGPASFVDDSTSLSKRINGGNNGQNRIELFTAREVSGVEESLMGLESRVTEEMNLNLLKNFTSVEVDNALRQMHPLKSLGLDGLAGPERFYF